MAEKKYYQGIGRRKTAIAHVRLFLGGSGVVTVNGKKMNEYFGAHTTLHNTISRPLTEVGKASIADVEAKVIGGGLRGQADAISLGIARAIIAYDETIKKSLKDKGLLTRDARKKERKKFGKRGARRSTQWRKR
ncbi:MAG: 30S ribosomal protein S9 [Patescibacteria group bacterium]|jgi:small subunit ribosomal protein S9